MGDEGKIFVGGLHWNTTNEGLKAYFEQFGQVVDCNIMKDPTGRSRCFGFVTFADHIVVDIVLQKSHILDKKQIDPKRAIPKDQPHPLPQSASVSSEVQSKAIKEENKVFVGGIHVEADENDLKEVMSKYDEVVETILMRDRETERSRGFGFVTFTSLEGAQKACADTDLRIRNRKVEVKMAVPKGKQPASKGSGNNPSSDPYAAWAEYFKQYPEYYEAMMKAYSNPNAMAAYYNQYYAAAGPNSTNVPIESHTHAADHLNPNFTMDPSYYAAASMMSSGSSLPLGQTAPTISIPGGGVDSYRPHDGHHRSRRPQVRSHSGSRGKSRSVSRTRSRSTNRSRSRSKSRSRGRSRSPRRDSRDRKSRHLDRRDRGRDMPSGYDLNHIRDKPPRGRDDGYESFSGSLDNFYAGMPPRGHPSQTIPPNYQQFYRDQFDPSHGNYPPPPPAHYDQYHPDLYQPEESRGSGLYQNSGRLTRSYHPHSRSDTHRRRNN